MGIIPSRYPGLNRGRSSGDAEAAACAADLFDTSATLLQGVQHFARPRLNEKLNGPPPGPGGRSDRRELCAIGAAKNREGKVR